MQILYKYCANIVQILLKYSLVYSKWEQVISSLLWCFKFFGNLLTYLVTWAISRVACATKNYENALIILNLETLEQRRIELCRRFARNGIINNTLNDLFPLNNKIHRMNNRKHEIYKVNFANTNRLKNGSVISIQKLLNEEQWTTLVMHK